MQPRSEHSPSRRRVLGAGAALTGLGIARPAHAALGAVAARARDDELLDRGLARIATGSPSVRVHRSNHAAMVVETLHHLGQAGRIERWLDEHLEPLRRRAMTRPLDAGTWKQSLGDEGRCSEWFALFQREIAEHGGGGALGRWAPRLVPGLAGAATHGLIRTAHGARALSTLDTPVRRNELALGLTYWAVTYQELPWDGSLAPRASVEDAFALLMPRLPSVEPPQGSIVSGLTGLNETPSFTPVAGFVEVSDPLRTLSEICARFARVYLAHPARRVHFTHAVTAPSALRLLLPYLDEETARAAVRYAWQAAAGLYVVYGDPRAKGRAPTPLAREALIDRATTRGFPHGIKLTEACLREAPHAERELFLSTATDAAMRHEG